MCYNGGMDVEVLLAAARRGAEPVVDDGMVDSVPPGGLPVVTHELPVVARGLPVVAHGLPAMVCGLSEMARELKAPIATLRQLALLFDEGRTDAKQIQTEMVEVSELAIRQVNDLMRLERLERGDYEMEPVAVRAVCAEACGELAKVTGKARAVEVECRNRIPLVVANRELLISAVYNFLLNAAIAAQDAVQLTLHDTRDGVQIAVRDFGPASMAMRPSELPLTIATRFLRYMRAETEVVRHRDGMSFCMWLPRSRQGMLW